MSARLSSIEEVSQQAYDIFLELAPDNLTIEDIELFNAHSEELGYIEDSVPDESWASLVAYEQETEAEHFVQVTVGLETDQGDVMFAKILISRDLDAPFCHIVWKQ
ncbi:DUF440 domain-containing protein [Pseudoalteromonas rubra]|uniref:DUF440 domain-containing protein n=1 Tax=Pseudoalteromonas rubra TaxID=43658 RepID=A0A5S3WJM2_9GAMM|nr:DUF440 family protein [Pseudoalteromonas rubra]TMP27379.1 DUF440 domain-containing protein [Pseudoalteromonas rubra]TMP36917.1 DUF440 domain-containing protein [Pseudoalteromonas rubra]